MTIKFKTLHIHHFLSFDNSTIDLSNKGYCLVKGINKNPKDSAKSNGSGKSTIWNALSFALLGETLSGLKTNLPNLYFNDGCYVELEFEIDNNKYKLIRSKDDTTLGTTLKVYLNGEDKSGKGIRESQAVLDQLLPDITSELLGSVIILGQGMPQKFSSNSPSGRKEVLEHLSKSDFMIQDLKNRISNREISLNSTLRAYNDELISLDSKEEVFTNLLKETNDKLLNYLNTCSYVDQINLLGTELESKKQEYDKLSKESMELQEKKVAKTRELFDITTEKQKIKDRLTKEHEDQTTLFLNERQPLLTSMFTQEQELTKLKNIKDVCPTCGQKIPNVIKPDTSKLEEDLRITKETLHTLDEEMAEDTRLFKETLFKLDTKFQDACTNLDKDILLINTELDSYSLRIGGLSEDINSKNQELLKLNSLQESFESSKKELEDKKIELEKSLNEIATRKKEITLNKSNVESHLSVISKMNTLIKRDFRGVLLGNVINFIDSKAKEYASKIFNSSNIQFVLNGNNIDITFEGKDYENLSGGEKQRVDVIVQFALRDMMSQYLNFSSNILVLDEITDALDSVSCDKVINFISEELKDVESVFIVSHHSDELQLPVDSEIIVEKNIYGVSEVTK